MESAKLFHIYHEYKFIAKQCEMLSVLKQSFAQLWIKKDASLQQNI